MGGAKSVVDKKIRHRCQLSGKFGSIFGLFPMETNIFRSIRISPDLSDAVLALASSPMTSDVATGRPDQVGQTCCNRF